MTEFALIYGEGALDLVAAQKLMRSLGVPLEGATLIDTRGRGGFWRRAPKYEQMARHNGPVFGLTDLDRDECAPRLLRDKLRHFPHARNALRIAVRALESWMLADRNAIAGFMRVPGRRIPTDPDALHDPEFELVNVARHSTLKSIRGDMVPQQGKSGKVGAGYEARMREFIVDAWDPRPATVWIEGLDKIQKQRGINFCVDFSATPYYLGRVGQDTNRPFPWVVSDFGLIDAIESGLVKIPQLAVRDTTGSSIPGYFNIWHWILPQLTTAEKGGRKAAPKPEAILKYAHMPMAMLAGLWEVEWRRRQADEDDKRPPVFIIVCKNTQVARVLYEWIALDQPPPGIPQSKIDPFKNADGKLNTIRVDSKVVRETDTGEAKSDESRWMRFTLDTVGKTAWPVDALGRPVYPDGFAALAEKLQRPLHPPGRDVRCIVSVGMLTEGWDCNTVTHIVGLRPFMSQLLCEQVVGRGLRRTRYELNDDGRFSEETAKIFGVPFQVIPFKANPTGTAPAPAKRWHVHALPAKAMFEIRYPRVEGYTQAIRNRITVNWDDIPCITVDPQKIPPEVQLGRLLPSASGRLSVLGPGRSEEATLDPYRAQRRIQELKFDLAQALVRDCAKSRRCEVPAHALFPQLLGVVERYLREKVKVEPPSDLRDVFLAPYYTWVVERLTDAIGPDTAAGEVPEVPRYEAHRPAGSTADVDFWTSRELREVVRSHVNFMVPDTKKWEQSAAYLIDTHPATQAFVKNAGLGFAIPYVHNGQTHEYVPDFIVRLKRDTAEYLIAETKGFYELEEVKREAAKRWVRAVNAEGSFGRWHYEVAKRVSDIPHLLSSVIGA